MRFQLDQRLDQVREAHFIYNEALHRDNQPINDATFTFWEWKCEPVGQHHVPDAICVIAMPHPTRPYPVLPVSNQIPSHFILRVNIVTTHNLI
jgi:hypothetical protein